MAKWALVGGVFRKGVTHVVSIGGRLSNVKSGDAHLRQNTDNLVAYVCKGASREAGKALGLHRYGEGAPIIGKRCGWTQNIGAAARGRG